MKYLYLLILFTIGMNLSARSQLLIERRNIAEVRKYEAENGSENQGFKKMQVGADFFHGAQEKVEYFPLTFKRINDTFKPKCVVEYYYSDKDSIINAIVYDWNIMNEVTNLKTDGYKFDQQTDRKDEYIQQYNSIRDQLIKLFGEPSRTKKIKEDGHLVAGETDWYLKNMDLRLTMLFSSQLQVAGPFKLGSFRVRLVTDWK